MESKASSVSYLVAAVVFFAIKIAGHFGAFSFMGDAAGYVVNSFIQIFALVVIPFFIYKLMTKHKTKKILTDFGFKKVNKKTVGYSFLIGVFAFTGVVVISLMWQNILALIGYQSIFGQGDAPANFWMLLVGVLTTAIMPAFCEEFLNRGMLLNNTKKFGIKRAIFISALLFALLHFNINQVFYAFLIGLLLGGLTIITKSIWPAIIIHFTNNFLSVILGYVGSEGVAQTSVDNVFNFLFGQNPFLTTLNIVVLIVISVVGIAWCTGKIWIIEKQTQVEDMLGDIAVRYKPYDNSELGLNPSAEMIAEQEKLKEAGVEIKQEAYDGEVFVKMAERAKY